MHDEKTFNRKKLKEYITSATKEATMEAIDGNTEKALDKFGGICDILESIGQRQSVFYAATLSAIASVHEKTGGDLSAIEYCLEAKNILDQLSENSSNSYAVLLNRIGDLYRRNRQEAQAVKYYGQAYRLFQALGEEDNASMIIKKLGS